MLFMWIIIILSVSVSFLSEISFTSGRLSSQQAGRTSNMLKMHCSWNRHWSQLFQHCFHFTFLFLISSLLFSSLCLFCSRCQLHLKMKECGEFFSHLRCHSSVLMLLTCKDLLYLRVAYVTESTLSKHSSCQGTVLPSSFCFSQTKW